MSQPLKRRVRWMDFFKRSSPQALPDPAEPSAPLVESSAPATGRDTRFWNELYWFLVIGLGAWILAALVLPHRMVNTLSLLHYENMLNQDTEALVQRKAVLEKATEAMENDPIYQEGVYRKRLLVKRANEEYVEPAPALFR